MNSKANFEIDKFTFLLEVATDVFNVDALNNKRDTMHTFARIAIANELRFKFTLTEIGKFLNKDHASVSHYFKKHADLLQYDKTYLSYYFKFKTEVEKPVNQQNFVLSKLKNEIAKINTELINMNYTPDQIILFWNDCVLDKSKFST